MATMTAGLILSAFVLVSLVSYIVGYGSGFDDGTREIDGEDASA